MGNDTTKLESFELDHREVKAPYIREAAFYEDKENGVVSKYDIRLCQPNEDALEPEVMHSIEHLVAEKTREMISGVIDISPMGCLTGFYLNLFGRRDFETIKAEIIAAFAEASKSEKVLAMNAKQCGNYKLHAPELAKARLVKFVEEING